MQRYWVYFMSNKNGNVLYTGVTNNLERRVREHRTGEILGFTKIYRCYYLVYYEEYSNITVAIAREKELKKLARWKKEELIKTMNPGRKDLATDWT